MTSDTPDISSDLESELSALRFSAVAILMRLRQAIVESGDPELIIDLSQRYLAGTERLAAIDFARDEIQRIADLGYPIAAPTRRTHDAESPVITGDAGVSLPDDGSEQAG